MRETIFVIVVVGMFSTIVIMCMVLSWMAFECTELGQIVIKWTRERKKRMSDFYVIDSIKAEKDFQTAVNLIQCKDCKHHRNRTGRCDVWSTNTPVDGYCYRSERKEK